MGGFVFKDFDFSEDMVSRYGHVIVLGDRLDQIASTSALYILSSVKEGLLGEGNEFLLQ